MSDNIPFDIQLEIIEKVPDVKSLIRFRSVSKQWKSFIESSEFIACYGVRHTQPNRLLIRYTDILQKVKYVSFVDGDNDIFNQQQDFGPIRQLDNLRVIGTSCGLWCLQCRKNWPTDIVVIWNPSIRKSVSIVVPFGVTSSLCKMTYFGFGVCPSTYDPTIVIMSYCNTSLENKDTDKWRVDVFSLSSKIWKRIPSSNLPRESIFEVKTQVAIDRFIYWVFEERIVGNDGVREYKYLILSFDLITHEFKEINLPHSLANRFTLNLSISKLRESLVVSAYTNEVNNGGVYSVWMMEKEGGVMTSIKKLFNIKTPYNSAVRNVLGFTMTDEPIMETKTYPQKFGRVKVYKPCSEHINDLGINGERGSFFSCPYTETLLLVDQSDCCIIRIK